MTAFLEGEQDSRLCETLSSFCHWCPQQDCHPWGGSGGPTPLPLRLRTLCITAHSHFLCSDLISFVLPASYYLEGLLFINTSFPVLICIYPFGMLPKSVSTLSGNNLLCFRGQTSKWVQCGPCVLYPGARHCKIVLTLCMEVGLDHWPKNIY